MNGHKSAIQYKDGQKLLYEGTCKVVFFNFVLGSLLAAYLYNNNVPAQIIINWMIGFVSIIVLRFTHCIIVMKKELYISNPKLHIKIFIFLTLMTGLAWTSIYFITLPYIDNATRLVIFLVFAGMCAGATSSLGVYLPAFIVYIVAIFMPVIIYDLYLSDLNRTIISVIFLFYLTGATIVAISFQRLLTGIFYLTEQNVILINKLEELTITDSLTALFNKRHFNKIIKDEYYRAKRNQQSFAFISIDVDNFKLVNDNFGHPFGDKFLTYIAYYLRNYLRHDGDIIFRLGGDEFAALMINITEQETKTICENIKNEFLKTPGFDYQPHDIKHENILEKVSLSIGVVYVPYEVNIKIPQINEKADQLLYDAKNEGKNKIKYVCLT